MELSVEMLRALVDDGGLAELSRWEAPVDPTFCIGAMTPPVTPVTSPRRRPRSESPREMRVM